jgi:hypothetical protein
LRSKPATFALLLRRGQRFVDQLGDVLLLDALNGMNRLF